MSLAKTFDLTDLTKSPLEQVVMYGHPDVQGIDGLLLKFGSSQTSLFVNPDDDSLCWSDSDVYPQYHGQIMKSNGFWHSCIGKQAAFIWRMQNQAGVTDAVQFMFGPQDSGFMIVQLMAIASGIRIFSLKNEGVDVRG